MISLGEKEKETPETRADKWRRGYRWSFNCPRPCKTTEAEDQPDRQTWSERIARYDPRWDSDRRQRTGCSTPNVSQWQSFMVKRDWYRKVNLLTKPKPPPLWPPSP